MTLPGDEVTEIALGLRMICGRGRPGPRLEMDTGPAPGRSYSFGPVGYNMTAEELVALESAARLARQWLAAHGGQPTSIFPMPDLDPKLEHGLDEENEPRKLVLGMLLRVPAGALHDDRPEEIFCVAARDVHHGFWIVGDNGDNESPANSFNIGDTLPEGWQVVPRDLLLATIQAAEAVTEARDRRARQKPPVATPAPGPGRWWEFWR